MSETLPQQGDRRTSPGGWRVLQRAHELWRAGDYTACLTELAGESDVLALVLRGRALLRLGRPRDAIALLHDVETPSARVVLAQAFARSRDQGSAREIAGMLREARLEVPQVARRSRAAAPSSPGWAATPTARRRISKTRWSTPHPLRALHITNFVRGSRRGAKITRNRHICSRWQRAMCSTIRATTSGSSPTSRGRSRR